MKRSRSSEEQIIGILKEHQAGLSAQDLCRLIGLGCRVRIARQSL
jgi:putative transposase